MNSNKRITLDNSSQYIDIVKKGDKYSLELYSINFDEEEKCEYIVRVYPNPTGIFKDLETASEEAKRILLEDI